MKLELTSKQFRRLLDMAYIGNWILNSTRGDDRFRDYDEVESLLFAKARELGMSALVAGLTVGGKALGKSAAMNSCTAIVFAAGKVIHWLKCVPKLLPAKGRKNNR